MSMYAISSYAINATKDQQIVVSRNERWKGQSLAFSGTSRSR